jgi:hypothetical protein
VTLDALPSLARGYSLLEALASVRERLAMGGDVQDDSEDAKGEPQQSLEPSHTVRFGIDANRLEP